MTSRPGREQEKDWKWTRKASDCQLAFDCDTAIIQGPAQRCRLDKCLKLALDSRKHILTLAGALGVHLPGPRPQRFGNGTPLQYSCLENPMDGGAWWATVHGVTKESDMT